MRRYAYGLLLLALMLAACAPSPDEPLEITFIDVGQGAAVLLDSDAATVLVDGGQGQHAYEHLRAEDIDSLDLIVASHAHADHIGGFTPILENLAVEEIWYNGQTHTTQTFERFIDAALESDARYTEPTRGDRRSFGSLGIEVLHPTTSAADYEGDLHDKNIVVRAHYGDVAALLPGDAEDDVEGELIDAGVDLKAEILKMGHHGSRTSSSAPFVEAVDPEIAVYQASDGNQYGHPHDEALSNVTRTGAEVYGTDVSGTIRITTEGRDLTVHSASPAADRPVADAPDDSCVDINDAAPETLTEIIHVGPDGAASIEQKRPFEAVEELDRVDGIGPARLNDIQEQDLACAP